MTTNGLQELVRKASIKLTKQSYRMTRVIVNADEHCKLLNGVKDLLNAIRVSKKLLEHIHELLK